MVFLHTALSHTHLCPKFLLFIRIPVLCYPSIASQKLDRRDPHPDQVTAVGFRWAYILVGNASTQSETHCYPKLTSHVAVEKSETQRQDVI